MKRILTLALVVSAALPVGVASASLPHGGPTTMGGYYFYARTCVPLTTTTSMCGQEFATSPGPGAWGQPSRGYFECYTMLTSTGTQLQWAEVSYGPFVFLGSGTAFGTAGLNAYSPPYATVSSFLAGWSNFFSFLGSGTTFDSGQTSGSVTINNATHKVVAGNTGISISGTVRTYNPSTGTYSWNPGSLACAITPNTGTGPNYAYAYPNGLVG